MSDITEHDRLKREGKSSVATAMEKALALAHDLQGQMDALKVRAECAEAKAAALGKRIEWMGGDQMKREDALLSRLEAAEKVCRSAEKLQIDMTGRPTFEHAYADWMNEIFEELQAWKSSRQEKP